MEKLLNKIASFKTTPSLLIYLGALVSAIILTCFITYLLSDDQKYLLTEVGRNAKQGLTYLICSFIAITLLSFGNFRTIKKYPGKPRLLASISLLLLFIGSIISYLVFLGFAESENWVRDSLFGDESLEGLSTIWQFGLCADILAFSGFVGARITKITEKSSNKTIHIFKTISLISLTCLTLYSISVVLSGGTEESDLLKNDFMFLVFGLASTLILFVCWATATIISFSKKHRH